MDRSEIARRAGSLVLAVLCLLVVPQVALAAFSARQAPALSVSTARLVAPTAVTGTFVCSRVLLTETVSVSVSGFADAGPAGSTYVFRLLVGGQQESSTTSTGRTATLAGSRNRDLTATTWTITIGATLRSWTGPVSTTTFTCKANNNSNGAL